MKTKTYKPTERNFLRWLKKECDKMHCLYRLPSSLHLLDQLPQWQKDFKADLGFDYQVLKAQVSVQRKNWSVDDYYLNKDGWRKFPLY